MKLYVEYQKYNMFRQPDWRFERVRRLASRHPTPGRITKRDDPYVRKARTFLLRWRHREPEDREELFVANPGLYYAYEIYERAQEDPQAALLLEARLLTQTPYHDIANACDTIPATVEWYEALFFNVRDKLAARDWITSRVLVPAMIRNFGLLDQPHHAQSTDDDNNLPPFPVWSDQVIARPFLDASLKMFAYFGGAVLCDFMIHGFQSGKLLHNADNLAQFLDEHWALTLRARSAQAARTFQINKYNVMELFATHARIIEVEKSEDSLDAKRSAIERHVSALMDEIPWASGDDAAQASSGTPLAIYDESAAELRDDELLLVAGGETPQAVDGLQSLALPAPRKPSPQPAAAPPQPAPAAEPSQ